MFDRIIAGGQAKAAERKALIFKSEKKIFEEWNDVNSALHPTEEILQCSQ